MPVAAATSPRAASADELASCARVTLLGVLITVEGLDGAGKTTLIAGLTEQLDATVLREPGGVELSERIRELVKDPALTVDPRAEALLYAAARAQLVAEKLRPLLDGGTTVILDRFIDSSLAYQGGGRGLGVEEIRTLNEFGTGGLEPDKTLLLRVDPAVGLGRIADREADRLELAGGEFFARVAKTYDELAAAAPERFVVLDATQPPETVLAAALRQALDMNEALSLLADVFDDPINNAWALEELRGQWLDLASEERDALTPLAKLAAQRIAEAKAAPPAEGAAAPPPATDADLATPDEAELRAALRFGVAPSPE